MGTHASQEPESKTTANSAVQSGKSEQEFGSRHEILGCQPEQHRSQHAQISHIASQTLPIFRAVLFYGS